MKVRHFRLVDLPYFEGRTVEAGAQQWLATEGLDYLAADPLARTIELNGTPVVSGGFVDIGNDTAAAWALLAPVPRSVLFRVQGVFHERLQRAQERFSRVETHVELSFMLSHRWVRTIGFDLDKRRPSLLAAGKIFARYVYVGNRK